MVLSDPCVGKKWQRQILFIATFRTNESLLTLQQHNTVEVTDRLTFY